MFKTRRSLKITKHIQLMRFPQKLAIIVTRRYLFLHPILFAPKFYFICFNELFIITRKTWYSLSRLLDFFEYFNIWKSRNKQRNQKANKEENNIINFLVSILFNCAFVQLMTAFFLSALDYCIHLQVVFNSGRITVKRLSCIFLVQNLQTFFLFQMMPVQNAFRLIKRIDAKLSCLESRPCERKCSEPDQNR